APARPPRPRSRPHRPGSRLMDVEDLRPEWCPPLPPVGGFDPRSGDLRCPWCMGEYPLADDADPDACPGCGRAIMICGREIGEIGELDEDAVVLALRTDADARYLHW